MAAEGVARGWDPEFESALLQRRVLCQPLFNARQTGLNKQQAVQEKRRCWARSEHGIARPRTYALRSAEFLTCVENWPGVPRRADAPGLYYSSSTPEPRKRGGKRRRQPIAQTGQRSSGSGCLSGPRGARRTAIKPAEARVTSCGVQSGAHEEKTAGKNPCSRSHYGIGNGDCRRAQRAKD